FNKAAVCSPRHSTYVLSSGSSLAIKAQNTHPSARGCTVPSMYSERHPAHKRSSIRRGGTSELGIHLGMQALDEVVDGHAPLGRVRTAGVDAGRARFHVVVTDHEDVRQLLQLGPADPCAERLVG